MSQDFREDNKGTPVPMTIDWEDRVCEVTNEEWEKGTQYVSDLNILYEDIYEMFRGGRPDKKYDWQSDITLRKAFQVAWTTVSYALNKIFGGDPIIGVKGFNTKGCAQREILLSKWMDKDKSLLFHTMSWLRLSLNGVVFCKKSWDQELVQGQGMMLPKKDQPHNIVLNNKDVVVDWALEPGQSCREGRFVIHEQIKDLSELQKNKDKWKLMNLDQIKIRVDTKKTQYEARHAREKQKDLMNDKPTSSFYRSVVLRERQGTFAVKYNEKKQQWIPEFDPEKIYKKNSKYKFMEMITWVANPDDENVLIRFIPNIYGEKTIWDGHLYLDPERWHSSGQIEPAMDLINAIDDNVNAMMDATWQNLMPPTVFNKFALVEWDTIKYAPGQKWMVGGNPADSVMFHRPTGMPNDVWMKHQLLDSESQLTTSITQNLQGQGTEKTATVGTLNAQYSASKLDFLVQLYEQMVMIPDAQMTLRFAQLFANPVTFVSMLGEPFQFDKGFKEEYQYQPVASSVKSDQQKEKEIQEDIQLIQIAASIQNPATPKVLNVLFSNILRNRGEPKLASLFDEDFYEPSSPAGNVQMMNRMLPQGTPSNQAGVPMSLPERSARGAQSPPQKVG